MESVRKRGRPCRKLECAECEKNFTCYNSWYAHMQCSHRPPTVPCKHCDSKFRTVSVRNQHFYAAMFSAQRVGRPPLLN